jgi:LysR family glycine cleavage system transcriptional activator
MQRSRSSLPPLSALRAFEAAVRLGRFKAAAEELRLTQSAISHQINSLESHFRVRLFMRQGNRLVLTKEGALYGTSILKAFSELSQAGQILISKERKEIVRVSATPSFATLAALPYLHRFKAINAPLDLRLEARSTDVNFDTESIDAEIHGGGPPFPGLHSHRLFRSKLEPLAHPSLYEKFSPIRAAKDLARMPLIEFKSFPGLWEKWFAKWDRKIKLDELSLSSDSLLTAIQMAESGAGVLLAPFPLVASVVASGRLKALFRPPLHIEGPDFYLLYRKRDAGTAKIKAVRKWLREVIAELEQRSGTSDL